MNDQRDEARQVALLDGLAAEFAPGVQSEAVYGSKFAYDLGIPWYVWTSVLLIIGAGSVWLHLPARLSNGSFLVFAGSCLYYGFRRFKHR